MSTRGETRSQSRHKVLFQHLLGQSVHAGYLVGGGLGIGMAGYHWIVGLPWIDAFLNAAMILGGMGPVDPTPTFAGKLFAGGYALLSGLVLVGVAALVLAPVLHYFAKELDEAGESPHGKTRVTKQGRGRVDAAGKGDQVAEPSIADQPASS